MNKDLQKMYICETNVGGEMVYLENPQLHIARERKLGKTPEQIRQTIAITITKNINHARIFGVKDVEKWAEPYKAVFGKVTFIEVRDATMGDIIAQATELGMEIPEEVRKAHKKEINRRYYLNKRAKEIKINEEELVAYGLNSDLSPELINLNMADRYEDVVIKITDNIRVVYYDTDRPSGLYKRLSRELFRRQHYSLIEGDRLYLIFTSENEIDLDKCHFKLNEAKTLKDGQLTFKKDGIVLKKSPTKVIKKFNL